MSTIKADKLENRLGPRAAFQARRVANTAAAGVAALDVEDLDAGSNYNTTTYTFTAPVAGVYLFFAQLLPLATTGNAWHFRKNGVKYGPQWYAINADEIVSGTTVMALQQGDTVLMYIDTVGFEAAYTHFGGVQL